MKYSHNKNLTNTAKALRKNMTKEERHLWYDFLRDYPVRFLRQKVIGNYIVDAAEAIDAEEAEMIFEVVLQLIISDNVISPSEISTAIAIAEALEIETEMAILLLLDMVKTEPELEIDFE